VRNPYVPEAVHQYGLPAFPVDYQGPEYDGAREGYPLMPYGMGDCRTFMDVPPLVHLEGGLTCINPDYEALHRFALSAVGRDSAFPDRSLVPNPTVAPGGRVDLQLTVEREENGMGHFLINELLMFTDPAPGIDGLLVEMKTLQGDRTFTNAPVPALNIFGNAHLNCCLPCPLMLYPNQTLVISVINRTIPAVDVRVRVVARGRRFMPYHNMPLVEELERCWAMQRTSPYWLQIDGEFGEARITGSGQTQAQMSIPGGGFFEMIWPRVQIVPDVPGLVGADDIDVEVTDGRVGRRSMDGPISLGGHYAVETKGVAGFMDGRFRSASACHCPPPTQLYRGNTRLIHDFSNRSATGAIIRLTYAGCMHYADRCPPQADLDLVRRYGHGDARALRKAQEQGDKVALSFLEENPLYAEQEEDCPIPSAQACAEEYDEPYAATPPPALPPEPDPTRIVNMHRPSKPYYGPGSSGSLPWHYSWGVDQKGETHLVIRDPSQHPNNVFVRFATAQELGPFKAWLDQINARSGFSGLGFMGRSAPKGEWEAI
jgi:hypothetical protein